MANKGRMIPPPGGYEFRLKLLNLNALNRFLCALRGVLARLSALLRVDLGELTIPYLQNRMLAPDSGIAGLEATADAFRMLFFIMRYRRIIPGNRHFAVVYQALAQIADKPTRYPLCAKIRARSSYLEAGPMSIPADGPAISPGY
jgi:hypothetical protein